MAEHAEKNTLETTIANLTDEREDGTDNTQPDSAYTPVFSKQVRTVVYVLGLIASCVGLGFMTFGDAAVGGSFRPWPASSPAVLASPTIRCATPDSGNSTSRRKLNLGCGKICGTIVSVEFFTPVF